MNLTMNQCSTDKQMNTQQAQALKSFLSKQITSLEKRIHSTKGYVTTYYDICDKDKPETDYYFKTMNRGKDLLREYRKERNTLAEIQKVVKKLAK